MMHSGTYVAAMVITFLISLGLMLRAVYVTSFRLLFVAAVVFLIGFAVMYNAGI